MHFFLLLDSFSYMLQIFVSNVSSPFATFLICSTNQPPNRCHTFFSWTVSRKAGWYETWLSVLSSYGYQWDIYRTNSISLGQKKFCYRLSPLKLVLKREKVRNILCLTSHLWQAFLLEFGGWAGKDIQDWLLNFNTNSLKWLITQHI